MLLRLATLIIMKSSMFLFLIIQSGAFAATVFTNNPAWNGISAQCCWGNGGEASPTFGQTIVVPSNGDQILTVFSFALFGSATSLDFGAYVQAWNGVATVGSPLFAGSGTTLTTPGAGVYTFNPNIALVPGASYILYFSTIGISQSSIAQLNFGVTATDTYAPGLFAFTNANLGAPENGNIGDLNTAFWVTNFANFNAADLAFSATFTSVPEPGTVPLLMVGFASLALSRRRLTRALGD